MSGVDGKYSGRSSSREDKAMSPSVSAGHEQRCHFEPVTTLILHPYTSSGDDSCCTEAVFIAIMFCESNQHFFLCVHREQPIFSTKAHVFQIDSGTKKDWLPASKTAVSVSYYYDSTRGTYRIISVDGSKVG